MDPGERASRKSWQVRPRLTGEGSGFENSARSPLFGRGRVAGVAHRTSKGLEAESKALRAKLECYGKEEGKAFHPVERATWRKSGEWKWTFRMRSRAEEKVDEERRKLQKELREVEKALVYPERCSGQPQECPAAASARGGAKEA